MLQIKTICPHCLQNEALSVLQVLDYQPKEAGKDREASGLVIDGGPLQPGSETAKLKALTTITTSCSCPKCRQFCFVHLEGKLSIKDINDNVLVSRHRHFASEFRVLGTTPEPEKIAAHPSWPHYVSQHFVQAKGFARQGVMPATIISELRSCLDVSFKVLGATKSGLYANIEEIAEQGLISPAFKEWAHILRNLGNKATHELQGTR